MPRISQKKLPVKLDDKQSERDTRELRIDKVGVRGLRFPIQVRDKTRSIQNTVATIGMFVDLPKEFKGTHMSRFVEVLNAHGSIIHVENISEILNPSIFSPPATSLILSPRPPRNEYRSPVVPVEPP